MLRSNFNPLQANIGLVTFHIHFNMFETRKLQKKFHSLLYLILQASVLFVYVIIFVLNVKHGF